MSFSDVEFDKSYSTIEDPTISQRLSTILIKKLISAQSWYRSCVTESEEENRLIFWCYSTHSINSMVLSNASNPNDSAQSQQNGQGPKTNQGYIDNGKNDSNKNNNNKRGNQSIKPLTAYTCPNMAMQSGMRCSPSDWSKLTKSQKDKIIEFTKITKQQNKTSSTTTVCNS